MLCKVCTEPMDEYQLGTVHSGCCAHEDVDVDPESRGDHGVCRDCTDEVGDMGEGWESL
jgi:hypothetical protein